MNRKNKPWTTIEEAFLLKHYKRKGSHYCAAKLGRPPRAIQTRWYVMKNIGQTADMLGGIEPITVTVTPDEGCGTDAKPDLRAALHTLADALADYLGGAR